MKNSQICGSRALNQTFQINYDYEKMYENQLEERKDYNYPPYVRLIRITIKDKSYEKLNSSADWLNNIVRDNFKGVILGPVYPQISRIKNKYHKDHLVLVLMDF